MWPEGAAPADREPLLSEVFRRYLPSRVVTGAAAGAGEDLPLLAAKRAWGRPTAYVCERYACQAPTTDPAALGGQLEAAGARSAPATDR